MIQPDNELELLVNRRQFFSRTSTGIGIAALASLFDRDLLASEKTSAGGLPGLPHFAAKAKRVIYLFQSGAPSQMDLFDYKPQLAEFRGPSCPTPIRKGQRLTGMTATRPAFPIAPSKFQFRPAWQVAAPG